MTWILLAFTAAAGTALAGLFKYLFARTVLKDVPPENRVEVIDAIGRAIARWSWR